MPYAPVQEEVKRRATKEEAAAILQGTPFEPKRFGGAA